MTTDKITLERIEKAHPKIRAKLKKDYIDCTNILGEGILLRFAYVYRTNAEQDALFKKRPKVTNARGGQSIHNYGLAFDIVLLYDKDGNGTYEAASWDMKKDFDDNKKADWMEVVNFFKQRGWEWGGDWANFKDAPHFQMTFGHTWKTLQVLVQSGKVVEKVYPTI